MSRLVRPALESNRSAPEQFSAEPGAIASRDLTSGERLPSPADKPDDVTNDNTIPGRWRRKAVGMVLVERNGPLGALERLLSESVPGHGRVALVTGGLATGK